MRRITKSDLKYMREINAYARVRYYHRGIWTTEYFYCPIQLLSFICEEYVLNLEVSINPYYNKFN